MARYTVQYHAAVGKIEWWVSPYKAEKHTRGAALKRAQHFIERFPGFPVRIYDKKTVKFWYLTNIEPV